MVGKPAYQPDRGDLCWLDFTPQAGIEQSGRRPALVISFKKFNVATGLAFVCPITSQVKGGSFEVAVPPGTGIGGIVLCDHMRSVDWLARNAEFHRKAPDSLLASVVARISPVIGA